MATGRPSVLSALALHKIVFGGFNNHTKQWIRLFRSIRFDKDKTDQPCISIVLLGTMDTNSFAWVRVVLLLSITFIGVSLSVPCKCTCGVPHVFTDYTIFRLPVRLYTLGVCCVRCEKEKQPIRSIVSTAHSTTSVARTNQQRRNHPNRSKELCRQKTARQPTKAAKQDRKSKAGPRLDSGQVNKLTTRLYTSTEASWREREREHEQQQEHEQEQEQERECKS